MSTPSPVAGLLEQVRLLRDEALQLKLEHASTLETIQPALRPSARNLLHYLALRRHDIRPLQRELAMLGLSSFGLLESHVLASLNAVIARLEDIAGLPESPPPTPPLDFIHGPRHLHDNADQLLGTARDGREVRIMVTLPSEAASDPKLIPALLEAGMEIARINCAHDDPETWLAMIRRCAMPRSPRAAPAASRLTWPAPSRAPAASARSAVYSSYVRSAISAAGWSVRPGSGSPPSRFPRHTLTRPVCA